ncbi:hypothetical protein GCK32_014422 [Trichostrongylus colubriformis]|uniref:Uncharacterized protein n=1 Tax=Trichostrongylus colubriformis TaxID=6319 RepID=A0AAN8IL38_TRICO
MLSFHESLKLIRLYLGNGRDRVPPQGAPAAHCDRDVRDAMPFESQLLVMHRLWLTLFTICVTLLAVMAFDGTVINFGEELNNLQRSYPKHQFPVVRAQRFYFPIADMSQD